jgi:predicted nuclease of restriction endonuclease-like (RecB) superfamily
MLGRMRLLFRKYPQIGSAIPASAMMKLPESLKTTAFKIPSSLMMESSQNDAPGPEILPAQAVLRFSWTHLIEFIAIEDPWKRAFFENECLNGNWSVRQLQRQIGSLLYERTGLSSDKETVINAGRKQAEKNSQTIHDLIRDPYVLEFTGLSDKAAYLERDLETLLLDHIQTFLLELGNGFCFEARQKRITVGNEHDYIDLVFYNRKLRCHLLIDLKIRAFQHGDAGQMNFYLNYWKDQMMEEGDNPPVGLILCAGKESAKVEYATAGMDEQLFVSRYLVALPKPEELEALIERDQAVFEEQAAYKAENKPKANYEAKVSHPCP